MWLIYSCDGEGVEDQSIFDLEKGITIHNIKCDNIHIP